MAILCEYKNIFGVPGEGFHKDRILGFAFWDLFGTFIIGLFINQYFGVDAVLVFIVLLFITVFLHWLFCVDTAFNKMLFLN
jgi:hypothetical protein